MIYGYARVSTVAQCRNGNSLEEQTEALTAYGCDKIITEAYTGKTTERPQLNELLQRLCAGDTLVVTKLDRFARTVIEGVLTVRMLFERGVKVAALTRAFFMRWKNACLRPAWCTADTVRCTAS